MPFYSFHCAKCTEDVELLIGISEKPVCPNCGGRRLTRLPSLPAAPARSPGLIRAARAQAAREGHLSNFSRAERKKR
ncbi:zinc ribbon domain-containing protein [Bradyrhizobium ontarionense]|uniref:Zinc ribbon domain-containing protein n=1 Tax=Bradyrhizobium ontarionense TaxID=2898149 RepID=A0ABY3RE59_9BRAD|nr:FmdB family zinc ribbon protein [Bradyrhizobium sp. A19]UFZ05387.1 zinc ribbon domain-containing protein [Bradyrhizobium sp. A19]